MPDRHRRDLEFLAWLRTATLEELRKAVAKRWPKWRRVALVRALEKRTM